MSSGKKQKKSTPKPASGTGAAPVDDVKAKFLQALQHKEHHDGPSLGPDDVRGKAGGAHGAVNTKREFRRKTG